MEKIQLDGRLGFSLDVTPEELKVLTGEDREAAKEMLLTLVMSDSCLLVGDTYFPVDWNEEVLQGIDENNLWFDLPSRNIKAVPCDVGDTVYFLTDNGKIYDCNVYDYEFAKERDEFGEVLPGTFVTVLHVTFLSDEGRITYTSLNWNQLGNRLFLSKREAEKARDGMGTVYSLIQEATVKSKETECCSVHRAKEIEKE